MSKSPQALENGVVEYWSNGVLGIKRITPGLGIAYGQ